MFFFFAEKKHCTNMLVSFLSFTEPGPHTGSVFYLFIYLFHTHMKKQTNKQTNKQKTSTLHNNHQQIEYIVPMQNKNNNLLIQTRVL